MKARKGTDERSKLIRALDRITPKIVKLRDAYTCQRCGRMPPPLDSSVLVVRRARQGLHWAHIYGRRDFLMRWNLINGLCLCNGCHRHFDSNHHMFVEWLDEKFPARGPYLRALRAQPRCTIKSETLKEWLAEHKEKLIELESEFK